ncbi:MAG: hypothetical protein J6I96_05135 [Oscillospiraceae bacterium]|nr:hypothetical protein [Oscillospiraceae bacterium]
MSSTFVDGRYVNRVYIQETAQELALVCDNNTASAVPQRTVVYNPETRKYTYNYDDKRKIELYSTPDVIAYYFGTNVTDPDRRS